MLNNYAGRSEDWYDQDEAGEPSRLTWREILALPLMIPLAMVFSVLMVVIPLAALVWIEALAPALAAARETAESGRLRHPALFWLGGCLIGVIALAVSGPEPLQATTVLLLVLAALFCLANTVIPAVALTVYCIRRAASAVRSLGSH